MTPSLLRGNSRVFSLIIAQTHYMRQTFFCQGGFDCLYNQKRSMLVSVSTVTVGVLKNLKRMG